MEKTKTEANVPQEAQEPKQRTFHCNDCGGVIYRHQVFCPQCGKKLDYYDFEE